MAHESNGRLVQRRPLLPCCLLLLLGEAPGHGYELADRLKQWGFELSGPGPVYRELRMLEESGLVRSTWSPPRSGPVPRVYELTSTGRKALEQADDDLTDLERLFHEFHQRHALVRAARPESRRRRDR
jgi:PadR family transcriptional regulator PadR